MSTSAEIIALLFLSVLADAANVELANNTNFLLLLVLALLGQNNTSTCGCACNGSVI